MTVEQLATTAKHYRDAGLLEAAEAFDAALAEIKRLQGVMSNQESLIDTLARRVDAVNISNATLAAENERLRKEVELDANADANEIQRCRGQVKRLEAENTELRVQLSRHDGPRYTRA
jgi:predicted RNase H-like nuclease (RuvC/YqgF family)